MGVKKSVVATIACSSFSRYTAASSLDSIPTSRSFGRPRTGVLARISERTAGAILQPQPPPWENCVRRMRSRSEEHTSELQSRQYLVCRLLLEKKKKDK